MKKMGEIVEDCYVEIDEDYEFDASQFFDFTKPELDSQIEEVERWFQVSGDDPHSPFVVKLDLDQILGPGESVGNSPESSKSRKSIKSSFSSSNNSDIDSRDGVPPSKKIAKGKGHPGGPPEAAKPKTKQPQKLRSSNFMEPTASHLAKQNTLHDKQKLSTHPCPSTSTRPRQRDKLERTTSSPVGSDATTSPVGSDDLGTMPQKLETGFVKKILHSRSLPRPTKSKAQVTAFQEFHFKTSERAIHHSSNKENKMTTGETLAEKFNKLSLASKSKGVSQSKRRLSSNSKGSNYSGRSSRGSFQSDFRR